MRDTSRSVEDFYSSLFDSLSGEERIMMAVESFECAKAIVISSFNEKLSESEIKKRLLIRFYGEDLSKEQTDYYLARIDQKYLKRG